MYIWGVIFLVANFFVEKSIMALGRRYLEFNEKNINFFTLKCYSRDSIGPIVKIYGTIVAVKYKTILEDNMLPFAEDIMVPDWKISHENDSKHQIFTNMWGD